MSFGGLGSIKRTEDDGRELSKGLVSYTWDKNSASLGLFGCTGLESWTFHRQRCFMFCFWLWIWVESCQNDCCLILLVWRVWHCGSICAHIHTKYQFGCKKHRHIHMNVRQNTQESLEPHCLTDSWMKKKEKLDHSGHSSVYTLEIGGTHKHRCLFSRLSSANS